MKINITKNNLIRWSNIYFSSVHIHIIYMYGWTYNFHSVCVLCIQNIHREQNVPIQFFKENFLVEYCKSFYIINIIRNGFQPSNKLENMAKVKALQVQWRYLILCILIHNYLKLFWTGYSLYEKIQYRKEKNI